MNGFALPLSVSEDECEGDITVDCDSRSLPVCATPGAMEVNGSLGAEGVSIDPVRLELADVPGDSLLRVVSLNADEVLDQ